MEPLGYLEFLNLESTATLVSIDKGRILEAFRRIMDGDWKPKGPPEYWDGRTAERIVHVLRSMQAIPVNETKADFTEVLARQ